MILSQPWFWSQSQMSYGKMCTRVGSIDFDIKFKIHLKKLMPGFVPFLLTDAAAIQELSF